MTDAKLIEVVRDCQSGKIKKFLGDGLVILNYDWWWELLKKQGQEVGDDHFFKPVPDEIDMFGGDR